MQTAPKQIKPTASHPLQFSARCRNVMALAPQCWHWHSYATLLFVCSTLGKRCLKSKNRLDLSHTRAKFYNYR